MLMETENNTNAKVMGGIVLIGGLAALWYLFFRNENKTLSGSPNSKKTKPIVKILGQEVREGTKEWKKLVERKRLFDQHPRNEQ